MTWLRILLNAPRMYRVLNEILDEFEASRSHFCGWPIPVRNSSIEDAHLIMRSIGTPHRARHRHG